MKGDIITQNLDGYAKDIKSNEITFFHYQAPTFNVEVKKEDNHLHIKSSGGNSQRRDGTRFILDYYSTNLSFLIKLNDLITKYALFKNNGYINHVNGLPAGFGGTLSVHYASNEKIYINDNQDSIMSDETEQDIYNLFHEEALRNNYDFTTNGSNQLIYDDLDIDYLQGTWKGSHFGDKIKVIIKDENIKIYVNDVLTDDTQYTIFEGKVRKHKLQEGIKTPKDYHDYEEFSGLSLLAKNNDFTITAYFMKNSYSTCNLIKE